MRLSASGFLRRALLRSRLSRLLASCGLLRRALLRRLLPDSRLRGATPRLLCGFVRCRGRACHRVSRDRRGCRRMDRRLRR
jgi:hypothetical protein